MHYIFFSPHLDDVALSCGGIVHSLIRQGNSALIWTIFAGDSPEDNFFPFAQSLHDRWQLSTDPIKIRRLEDENAMQELGVEFLHSDFADCIYRKNADGSALVNKEGDLYQEISGNQTEIVASLIHKAKNILSPMDIVVGPLGIGNHIDHRITRKMLEKLEFPRKMYYPDYPYVARNSSDLARYLPPESKLCKYDLDSQDITAWKRSIATYRSQISTFWESAEKMEENIDSYILQGGGDSLWKVVS